MLLNETFRMAGRAPTACVSLVPPPRRPPPPPCVIEIGPVTLGRDAYIGEMSVLDIDTGMGDGAQLGHVSALHTGQTVPAGERWHGSPAVRTDTQFLRVPAAPCGRLRRGRERALNETMLLHFLQDECSGYRRQAARRPLTLVEPSADDEPRPWWEQAAPPTAA